MKRIIVAKTFTPLYDEIEDRLRVVVNYEDIQNRVDFMITRNFILNLIPSAEEFILKYYSSEPLSNDGIAMDSHAKSKENEALLETDAVNLELLRTSEELLTEVNFYFDTATKITSVVFSSKKVTANISLDGLMLQKIFHIIKLAIPNIRWGISHCF